MGKNKEASDRYRIIDECWRYTERRWFKEDLLFKIESDLSELYGRPFSISTRTLDKDIEHLKNVIEREPNINLIDGKVGRHVYYRYEKSNMSLYRTGPSEEEKQFMKSALSVLTSFSGMQQFEWVHELIKELEVDPGSKGDVIELEANLDLKGSNYLTHIYEAIVNEQVLRVLYNDFKDTNPFEIIFHPHYLKQYNSRWFAIGKGISEKNRRVTWPIALDRIVKITNTDYDYEETETNWQDHFRDIVGIGHNDDAELTEIVLLFAKEQAPYIETKPIKSTVLNNMVRVENGKLKVKLKLYPNYELESLIMSFGEKVEVLSPDFLREKIRNRIKDSLRNY